MTLPPALTRLLRRWERCLSRPWDVLRDPAQRKRRRLPSARGWRAK